MRQSRALLAVVFLPYLLTGCSAVTDFDPKRKLSIGVDPVKDGGALDGCVEGERGCRTSCGNGVLERGETCDPPDSCPTSCDDGTACTTDRLTGSAKSCTAACEHQEITGCSQGDGCCAASCSARDDDDCSGTCGNGVVDPGETCDPQELCQAICSDGNACTVDRKLGSPTNCNVTCSFEQITACVDDDGCCPSGCSARNDDDCAESCGNGTLEPGETCDPASSCPTSCEDGNACTLNALTGSAANCNVACTSQVITQCKSEDGCCPAGCNSANDGDCSASCGNGMVEAEETCDPASSCPTTCEDGNACTIDSLTGSAANCTAACSSQTITQCRSGDGCCPDGCDANADGDCTATCNNGIVEEGETCDPRSTCPRECNDGNACTVDRLTGSVNNCMSACTHQSITQCRGGDGCCPPGCNANSDRDCTATCNNGTVERGETCDPASSCPRNCNDNNRCTIDSMTGSAQSCSVACSHQRVTQCRRGDGCCPPGCTIANDDDCSASCGDGVVTAPETCDRASSSNPCPTRESCDDRRACTIDGLSGSPQSCSSQCTHQPISQCRRESDGCCPEGCNIGGDSDCTASCGDGVVTAPERCDPRAPGGCPSNAGDCNDREACTADAVAGSMCDARCTNTPISECRRESDGCCPSSCTPANDADCKGCGDGVVTPPEKCDGNCPTEAMCRDTNACTDDRVRGNAQNCTAECENDPITACKNNDDCCPSGCTAAMDSDCPPEQPPPSGDGPPGND